MSSMGDNTKSADVSISVESVDDQSSSIPPPKIATTATEPPLSKKSRVSEASTKTQNKSWVWDHYDIVEGVKNILIVTRIRSKRLWSSNLKREGQGRQ
ncbi:hypothetical protein ACH5RR_036263 [Cinchona calisaya]|uniref:Uncharacterized protein n=1 Tax=Cinchona calisaya TaxID=153742 RepID=A0ABD2Y7E0_9GENT